MRNKPFLQKDISIPPKINKDIKIMETMFKIYSFFVFYFLSFMSIPQSHFTLPSRTMLTYLIALNPQELYITYNVLCIF